MNCKKCNIYLGNKKCLGCNTYLEMCSICLKDKLMLRFELYISTFVNLTPNYYNKIIIKSLKRDLKNFQKICWNCAK